MTEREGNMGNCHPKKTNGRGWHWFSRVDNFPCYPLVQSIIIILYWILIKYIVYIMFGFKTVYLSIWVCISYSVNSNAHTTPVRIILRSRYFLEFHPSSSNITRCQVPSRVRAWFHDSAGDINFYQMSLSQSESTILHECISNIYIYATYNFVLTI